MGKSKKTWLENIQTGVGKELSKKFFLEYTTEPKVSEILYPNRLKKEKGKTIIKINYVEPRINHLCNEWETLGFFTLSREIPILDRWERKRITQWKILNLEPVFKYCREKKNINFSKDEKEFLWNLSLDVRTRQQIIKEYPELDLINAILNYYAKHYINAYNLKISMIKDFPEQFETEEKRLKQINKPKWFFWNTEVKMKKIHDKILKDLELKYGSGNYKKKKMDVFDFIKYDNLEDNFFHYCNIKENNPDLVYSVDKKILKTLGLIKD